MRALALMLLVAGCASEGIAIEDYAEAARARQCRYYVQCGILASVEACDRTNIGWYYTDPVLIEAVAAGRVRWNAEAAERCAAAEASCDLTSDDHRIQCEPLTSGTLHDGEDCTLGEECISQECWTEPCYGQCCKGYCVGDTEPVPARIGEACRYSTCIEGYCNGSVCLPRLPAGASCDGMSSRQCEEGLVCGGDAAGRHCTALPSTGEACSAECAIDGEQCTTNNVCERAGLLYEPCLWDRDCARLYRCGSDMRCVDAGAALGELCLSNGFRCADLDAYCSFDTFRCESRYPLELPVCPDPL